MDASSVRPALCLSAASVRLSADALVASLFHRSAQLSSALVRCIPLYSCFSAGKLRYATSLLLLDDITRGRRGVQIARIASQLSTCTVRNDHRRVSSRSRQNVFRIVKYIKIRISLVMYMHVISDNDICRAYIVPISPSTLRLFYNYIMVIL